MYNCLNWHIQLIDSSLTYIYNNHESMCVRARACVRACVGLGFTFTQVVDVHLYNT